MKFMFSQAYWECLTCKVCLRLNMERMAGRRMLAQSLAHELWRKGIHVAHVYVDGLIDSPDTVVSTKLLVSSVCFNKYTTCFLQGKFLPHFEEIKANLEKVDGIVKPDAVAEGYWCEWQINAHITQTSTSCSTGYDTCTFSIDATQVSALATSELLDLWVGHATMEREGVVQYLTWQFQASWLNAAV